MQAEGLARGGSDYLLVETAQDTRNVKAALLGIEQAFRKLGYSLPVAVSGTIEPMGSMQAWRPALPVTQWVWKKP